MLAEQTEFLQETRFVDGGLSTTTGVTCRQRHARGDDLWQRLCPWRGFLHGSAATGLVVYYAYVRFGSYTEGVMMRQVLLYPGEDGYWVVECPSLPGCISQGRTREEAVKNIREAIDLYIEALVMDELPVPDEHFEALLVAV